MPLELIGIAALVLMIVLGAVTGNRIERRHYRSIREREKFYADVPLATTKRVPDYPEAPETTMVTGSAVISIDYFKRFLVGFQLFFGGRVRGYESLVERARREAILRMRAEARAKGASLVMAVRMETSTVFANAQKATGSIEVLAYGTAVVLPRHLRDKP